MQVTQSVNIPDQILDAREENTLVIFAGAGISVPPPSSLPCFKKLTEIIAEELCEEPSNKESAQLEEYLGRLDEKYEDIHDRVRRIISREDSEPTDLHRCIINLFGDCIYLRIVTTNYDRHFSKVLESLKLNGSIKKLPAEYSAPALPRGDRFSGLVYLHGNINQDSRELVVTDRDFGKAYLVEGWAGDFVRNLYLSDFTVLFLGYRHKDTLMKYLARGLTPLGGKKFALVSEEDLTQEGQSFWRSINVEPIAYPLVPENEKNKHIELTNALCETSKQLNMGLIDHEGRMQITVSALPPADLVERDYLLRAFRKEELTRLFCSYATKPWPEWLEKHGLLANLFSPSSNLNECEKILAEWFAGIAASDDTPGSLNLVARNGASLNPEVVFQLLRRLVLRDKLDDSLLVAEWLDLIIRNTKVQKLYPDDWLLEIFEKIEVQNNCALVKRILKHLLRIDVDIQHSMYGVAPSRRAKTLTEKHALDKLLKNFLKRNLKELSERVIDIVTEEIISAFEVLKSVGKASEESDLISLFRNSIASQENGVAGDGIDTLIDMLREAIEFLIMDNRQSRFTIYGRWKNSGVPLLERFYLYSLARDNCFSDSERVNEIISHGWLFKHAVQSEVYVLLSSLKELDSDTRDKLDNELREREQEYESIEDWQERMQALHSLFDRLDWICRSDYDSKVISSMHSTLKQNHDFKPSEHPEKAGIVFEDVHFKSPKDSQELLTMDPKEIISLVTAYESAPELKREDGKLVEYGVDSILNQISDATSRDWTFTEKMIRFLNAASEDHRKVWDHVLYGLARNRLSSTQWQVLSDLLKHCRQKEALQRQIAAVLESFPEEEIGITENTVEGLIGVAEELFEIAKETESPFFQRADRVDSLTEAINQPSGNLSIFFLKMLQLANRRENLILAERIVLILQRILAEESFSGRMGKVIISSQLRFLFNNYRKWTEENLLPLFDRSGELSADAWNGFLGWGTYNKPLLAALKMLIVETFDNANRIHERYWSKFSIVVTDLVVFVLEGEERYNVLRKLISKSTDQMLELFHRSLHSRLSRMNAPEVLKAWKEWLKGYVEKRLKGEYPKRFLPGEMKAVLETLFLHKDVFLEGTKLLLDLTDDAPQMPINNLIELLAEKKHCEENPVLCDKFLLWILKGQQELEWVTSRIRTICRDFQEDCQDEETKNSLSEQCIRLGL